MSSLVEQHLVALAERAGATAATSDLVASLALAAVKVGPDGAAKVLDDAGNERIGAGPHYGPMTLAELVAEIATTSPVLFRSPEPEPVQAKPQAPTKPDPNLTRRALRKGGRDADADKLADSQTPGATDFLASWATSRQMATEMRDPVNAARRATEQAAARHRDGNANQADRGNPYSRRHWNLTAQAMMEVGDPVKAAQLRGEAEAIPAHLDRPRSPFDHT